jgi:hypothetical protein
MFLWLLVATENYADSWDPSLIFDPSLAENTNPASHHRPVETLPCPCNAVCWIHMEE